MFWRGNLAKEKQEKLGKPRVKKIFGPTVNIFGMVFFLSLGVAFVLNVAKVIPISIWDVLWRFWPAYLIMFFLQLFARRSRFIRYLLVGVGVGLLATIGFFAASSVNPKAGSIFTELSPYLVTVRKLLGIELGQKLTEQNTISSGEFENVKDRNASFSIATGKLEITDNQSSDYFISDSTFFEHFGKPTTKVTQEGNNLNIGFETKQNVNTFLGGIQEASYYITFGQVDIPTNLDIKIQAGGVDAKIDNLEVGKFNLEVMAGTANLAIGESSLPQEINLRVAAGNLTLILPYDTFAEVKYDAGVGILTVDNAVLTTTGIYTTPKFSVTESPIRINVNLGAGRINIYTLEQIYF